MALELSAERGMVFRITHMRNLPWILQNGLYCAKAAVLDPNFAAIGDPELIQNRAKRTVAIGPGGTLSDYVPFYLTPKSPMLLNIKTGWRGMTRRANSEIVILVSSVPRLQENGISLIFTDRHAYMSTARWSIDPADLAHMIDWDILRNHDFARSDNYPDKMDRYQAEVLAHAHVPPQALIGIGCASDSERARIEKEVEAAGMALAVRARPNWYF